MSFWPFSTIHINTHVWVFVSNLSQDRFQIDSFPIKTLSVFKQNYCISVEGALELAKDKSVCEMLAFTKQRVVMEIPAERSPGRSLTDFLFSFPFPFILYFLLFTFLFVVLSLFFPLIWGLFKFSFLRPQTEFVLLPLSNYITFRFDFTFLLLFSFRLLVFIFNLFIFILKFLLFIKYIFFMLLVFKFWSSL